MRPFYIILTYNAFKNYFHELKKGDLVAVRPPLKKEETGLFVDLMYRKVEAFPSFLSQLLSVSKTLQAQVLKEFMPPHTYVIRDQNALLHVMTELSKTEFRKFITKEDRANCGLGIRLWNSLEEIFNFAGSEVLPFPFVLQPFFENLKDIRVIILGDQYVEAYQRDNSLNFRKNIFFGGKAIPHELTADEFKFCKKVMKRGKFPYAHLDMIYIDEKGPYLSEINLKGGIKGAKISTEEYERIIQENAEEDLKMWEKRFSPVKYLR